MKTLLQKTCVLISFILTGILLLSFGCNEKAENTITLGSEDVIDLSKNPIDTVLGKQLINNCIDSIRIDSTIKLTRVAESIHKNGLVALKNLALQMKGSYQGNYILGFRITYGLNSNNKIKLFYQPVFLKKDSTATVKTNVKYAAEESSTYYKYANSSPYFSPVTSQTVTAAVNNYTAHINFMNNIKKPAVWRGFKNGIDTDSTADAKSLVYSFQETDSIMIENNTDMIYIYNAAENKYANHKTYMRHSLLIGFEDKGVHSFYKKFGNLSHLCPPSCGLHLYDLK